MTEGVSGIVLVCGGGVGACVLRETTAAVMPPPIAAPAAKTAAWMMGDAMLRVGLGSERTETRLAGRCAGNPA
jgi:hypothetical protein